MYGLHPSRSITSHLKIVFYNTSHLSLVPFLGSLGASLSLPIDGFRPLGGHHHIHVLGGAQTHVLLGGAFTLQFLAFVTPTVHFKHGAFTKGLLGRDLGFS